MAAILAACLCWAIDNNLTRRVSSSDALFVAGSKGLVAKVDMSELTDPAIQTALILLGVVLGCVLSCTLSRCLPGRSDTLLDLTSLTIRICSRSAGLIIAVGLWMMHIKATLLR